MGGAVHVMRDPTRGGLASTLNEIAHSSDVGVAIDEASLPVRPEVQSACELLGLDPVYVANEGKVVDVYKRQQESYRRTKHALGASARHVVKARHPQQNPEKPQ